jgi:hypothetical protein
LWNISKHIVNSLILGLGSRSSGHVKGKISSFSLVTKKKTHH